MRDELTLYSIERYHSIPHVRDERRDSETIRLSFVRHFQRFTIMNNDNIAIALDRLKFYARDAVVTLAQVNSESPESKLTVVHMQTVKLISHGSAHPQ
jgi:hypothetical protein